MGAPSSADCPDGYIVVTNALTGEPECQPSDISSISDSAPKMDLELSTKEFDSIEELREEEGLDVEDEDLETAAGTDTTAGDDTTERGTISRGAAPPPCEEPPFEYAEEAICNPDALAFVPDWTGQQDPFLNEATCQYSVPIQANECPQGMGLHDQVVSYASEGISSLMQFLGKESTPLAESVLTAYIQESAEEPYDPAMISTAAYETSLAPHSDLKILFKWPFGLVRALRLPDALSSPVTDAPFGVENVELKTENLLINLDTLAQQLEIYGREQAIIWKEQEVKITITGTAREINLLDEKSKIDSLKSAITTLLIANDYVFSDGENRTAGTSFDIPTTVSVAEKIAIFYNSNATIDSVYARERGADYEELNLNSIGTSSALRDPTLVAYLVNIENILFDLEKSSPISLLDFVRKYHSPAVTITDGVSSTLPVGSAEGCIGNELSNILVDAGKSILDELAGLDDLFADKFAEYVCMTPEQFSRRDAEIRSSKEEFLGLLEKEANAILPVSDPLVRSVIQGIENISENGPTIEAAWEKLFNKMSMCGLLTLIGRTVEFIAKNDICGITAEKAMMIAIQSALKNLKPMDLKRVFDGIEPPALRSLIQDDFYGRISTFMTQVGSTTGLVFPWDYEQRLEAQTEEQERGLLLYSGELFRTPTESLPEEYEGSLATAFLQGYRHLAYNPPAGPMREELMAAYWDGYVQQERDIESDPTGVNPSFNVETEEYELTNEQVETISNNVRVTLNRQNGASVGQLIGGLAADTLNFLVEQLVASVMGILGENLTFDQIIGLFKDIPVLGAILRVLPAVSKCVINTNLKKDGEEISFSQLTENLFKGGEIDICNLKPAKKPIVMPNIELLLQLRVNTLWSSFQNALIEVLKQALISILLRTLMGILRETIELLLGFACQATDSDVENYLQGSLPPGEIPGGNMRDYLMGVMCPDANGASNIDETLADLMSSLLPGVSSGDAESLLGAQSDCNFVGRIEDNVTAAQLLDLFQGRATTGTLTAVLMIIDNHCQDLQRVLPTTSAIANFFQNLGNVFPQEYLDELRDLISETPAVVGIPANLCPEDEALDNLREALNCEGEATPEQIDAYIEAFQDRLGSTIEDMMSTLSNGLDSSLSSQIQTALAELMPKDEPGNLLIAEQVVAAQFEPFYSFYTRDLMHIMGASGRPFNAGLINMILANKNAVGQVGQIRNYGAHSAFVVGPGLGLIATLPPPLNFIASAGQLGGLGENLRKTYFGDPPEEGELEIDRCNEDIPIDRESYDEFVADGGFTSTSTAPEEDGPPTYQAWRRGQRQARAECRARNAAAINAGVGPGPYGFGKLRKPATIGRSLQTIFQDIGSYYEELPGSVGVQYSYPFSATLDFQLPPPGTFFDEGARLFDLTYNFETGLLQYIPYLSSEAGAPTIAALAYTTRAPEEEWTEVNTTSNARLQGVLEEYISDLPLPEDEASLTPANVGAGVLLDNITRFMDPDAGWSDPSSEELEGWLADCRRVVASVRAGVGISYARSIAENEDAFTYGQYNLEALTDVDVLDPGSELLDKGYNFVYLDDGRIFVEPPPKGGWLEVKDRLLPQSSETFCCPDKKELFNISSIVDRTLEGYKNAEEDPRLSLNPKTVNEPPFARILSRMNLASCEGNIITTIRVYAIEHILKGYATYNKFLPQVPEVHSDVLADYITQKMKEGLLDQPNQPGAPVWPPGLIPDTVYDPAAVEAGTGGRAERLHAYWYEFLEQCVQTYSRRIKAGAVTITGEINNAMTRLQTALDNYVEPKKSELRTARTALIALFFLNPLTAPFLSPFAPIVLPQVNLKNLRRKTKIDTIKSSESDAMIILKQLVKEELARMSEDIVDVFDTPPGGRVDNIYLDFLRNTYTSNQKNIFDIPLDPTSTTSPAVALTTPLAEHSESLELALRLQEDTFILQSYVKATQREPGLSMLRSADAVSLFPSGWIDDQVYPMQQVRDMLDYAISQGMNPNTPLGDLFEADSFKYGLRLVYVPSPDFVGAGGPLLDKMREDSSTNNLEGLFNHPATMGLGEFTIPIVYSSVVESPFYGTVDNFVTSFDADVDNFNSDTNGAFLWNDLALILTQTDQFRAMFEYSVPLNSVLALLGIYNSEAFLSSIGGDDGWNNQTPGGQPLNIPRPYRRWNQRTFPILKRKLKKQFLSTYRSNDFTYIDEDERSDRNSRREAARLRLDFDLNIGSLFDNLSWPVREKLVFTDPNCYAESTGTPGTLEVETEPEPDPTDDTPDYDDTPWTPDDEEPVCCRQVISIHPVFGEIYTTFPSTRGECRAEGGVEVDPFSVEGCEELIGEYDPGPDDPEDDDIDIDEPSGGDGGGPL